MFKLTYNMEMKFKSSVSYGVIVSVTVSNLRAQQDSRTVKHGISQCVHVCVKCQVSRSRWGGEEWHVHFSACTHVSRVDTEYLYTV